MANALILHGSFCRIPYAVLQGILEPNLISSREFESRSREFGALPEIPTRRDFVHRARLAAAALAGAAAASLAIVHSAFDDVRLAPQFKSPPSTQSPSSTQVGRMAGVGPQATSVARSCRMGLFHVESSPG
jgi:hypothetical protein